jgi:putative ABC transport system permease protein
VSTATIQFIAAGGLGVAAVIAAWRWELSLATDIFVVCLRAAGQLVAVGAVVALVFRVPLLSVPFLGVMVATASVVASRRLAPLPSALPTAATAVAAPALAVLGLLTLIGAFDFEPRAIVPGAGILIGGAMTAVGLAGRRYRDALRDRADEVEARLCLGDTARRALRPLALEAVQTALLPVLDQTRSVGLVTLPGTFVGLVLGGASPAEAARVQLLVLLALVAVQLTAARLATVLAVRACTLPGDRVIALD